MLPSVRTRCGQERSGDSGPPFAYAVPATAHLSRWSSAPTQRGCPHLRRGNRHRGHSPPFAALGSPPDTIVEGTQGKCKPRGEVRTLAHPFPCRSTVDEGAGDEL